MSTSPTQKTTSASFTLPNLPVGSQGVQNENYDYFSGSLTYPASSAMSSLPSINFSALSPSLTCTQQTSGPSLASRQITQWVSPTTDSSSFSSPSSLSSSSLLPNFTSRQVIPLDSTSSSTSSNRSSSPLSCYPFLPSEYQPTLSMSMSLSNNSSLLAQHLALSSSSNGTIASHSRSSSPEINLKKRKTPEPDGGNYPIQGQVPVTYPSIQETGHSAQQITEYAREVVTRMGSIKRDVELMDREILRMRMIRQEYCKQYEDLKEIIYKALGYQNMVFPALVAPEDVLIQNVENYLLKIQTVLGRFKQTT